MAEILHIHPKQKTLKKFEDCNGLEWWTHPESIDWEQHQKDESKRWLATSIEDKQAEIDDQKKMDI